MFKKALMILLASVFALALAMPGLKANAVRHPTPEGYSDHDYQKLAAFLDAEVTKPVDGQPVTASNGQWLFGEDYDPGDPASWGNRFTWIEVGGEYRISGINLSYPDELHEVGGELDVSDCAALAFLSVAANLLTGLNASGCTALESVRCFENRLEYIDLSGCGALRDLYCFDNALASLDLSGCARLAVVSASDNALASLELSDCELLGDLYVSRNQLTDLDLSGCPYLFYLTCGSNRLESLDVSHNPLLIRLECDGNALSELDLSANAELSELSCSDNPISELDLSSNPALCLLSCTGCGLTELDLSGHEALEMAACSDNPMTSIDISGCPALYQLECDVQLTSFDASDSPYIGIPRVGTEGRGSFGVEASVFYECKGEGWWFLLHARPAQGGTFLGWYDDEGELVSASAMFSVQFYSYQENPWGAYESFTARFSGGEASLPGDVDGNGSVTVSDAVTALRAAMGLIDLAPERFAAADVTGDGAVTVSDAVLILRTAMGLK